MDAQALMDSPDAELRTAITDLPRVSGSGGSEARHDRLCADGSTLVVTSRDGGAVEMVVVPPPA